VTDTALMPRDENGSILPPPDTVCAWCKESEDLVIYRCLDEIVWLHYGGCSGEWHKQRSLGL